MSRVLEFGYEISAKNLQPLVPVLKNWGALIEEYSQRFDYTDACWWYNERASISALAGATWRTPNWIALEEYSTRKRSDDGTEKAGRCDLYLDSTEISFAIEAKQAWQKIGPRVKDKTSTTKDVFKLALNDAKKLRVKKEAEHRLAMCFIVPLLPKSNTKDHLLNKTLGNWLTEIGKQLSPELIAWSFPKGARELASNSGRIFPGVCLIVKEVKRGI